MPTQGDATSAEAQDVFVTVCQAAATADGNGAVADVAGLGGFLMLELNNTAAGTTTANVEGSFDGINWYALGYQQVDATAAPARAVTGIAVAGTSKHLYQILDHTTRLRVRLSGTVPTLALTATVYALPG